MLLWHLSLCYLDPNVLNTILCDQKWQAVKFFDYFIFYKIMLILRIFMLQIKKFSYGFIFTLYALTLFCSVSEAIVMHLPLKKWSAHSITDWQTFELKKPTPSLLIEVTGNNETTYQITDLISPNGEVFVNSNINSNKVTGYEFPHASNEKSKNRSLSVINKFSALLVPNFFTKDSMPAGKWKYRVLGSNFFENDSVKINIIVKNTISSTQKMDIRLIIEEKSFWSQNPSYLQKMVETVQAVYNKYNIHLRIKMETLYSDKHNYNAPVDVIQLMEDKNLTLNTPPSVVKILLLGKMMYQDKPINGLSCLSGLVSQSHCFAALFADPLIAHTITPEQAGKVLSHELGHHLGLFHTHEKESYFKGLFDPFSDTNDEVLGKNIMDQGIHNEDPQFSAQQVYVLKLHPLVLDATDITF